MQPVDARKVARAAVDGHAVSLENAVLVGRHRDRKRAVKALAPGAKLHRLGDARRHSAHRGLHIGFAQRLGVRNIGFPEVRQVQTAERLQQCREHQKSGGKAHRFAHRALARKTERRRRGRPGQRHPQ